MFEAVWSCRLNCVALNILFILRFQCFGLLVCLFFEHSYETCLRSRVRPVRVDRPVLINSLGIDPAASSYLSAIVIYKPITLGPGNQRFAYYLCAAVPKEKVKAKTDQDSLHLFKKKIKVSDYLTVRLGLVLFDCTGSCSILGLCVLVGRLSYWVCFWIAGTVVQQGLSSKKSWSLAIIMWGKMQLVSPMLVIQKEAC